MKKFTMVAAIFALAFAMSASAASLSDMGTRNLKMGSRGDDVKAYQALYNACMGTDLKIDGIFGKDTAAKARAYQASKGLKVDAIIGQASKADIFACAQAKTATTTPTTTPTTDSTMSGTEGTLSSVNKLGAYNNTKVGEGAKDTMVYAIEAIAKDADQKIDSLTVSFANNRTSGTSSLRFTRLASEVSVWLDGKEIGRKAASAYSDDSNDVYVYRFTGMNGVIKQNMKGRIVVAVSANSTLDTTDVTNDIWNVAVGSLNGSAPTATVATSSTAGSSVSANGRYRDFLVSSNSFSVVDFQKATGEATFKVTTSATNPVARTIQVSKTADTNAVTLLAFDMKAENAAMLLQKMPVSVAVANGSGTAVVSSAQTVVKNLRMFVDGTEVDSQSAPSGLSGTVTFGNTSKLQKALSSNSVVKVEVKADIASRGITAIYNEGTTVSASYTGSATVELDNANRDTVTNMSGSVTGENQTLRTTGALVTMGASTAVFTPMAATGASSNRATFTIPVTVKAFDDTVYVGQAIQAAVAGAISGTNTFSYVFNESGAPTTAHTTPVAAGATGSTATTTISSNATVEGTSWRVDAGSEKTFTLQVIVSGSSVAKNVRVQLNDFKFFTDAALTTGATVQTLAPTSVFQTGYAQVF